jgi:hypothetical protein
MLPFCCLACLDADTARAWLCLKFVCSAVVRQASVIQTTSQVDRAKNCLARLIAIKN